MEAALAAAAFAPGLALGSFLNVVAARVPLRRSVARPRSACPACSRPIRPLDNVPLLSYALLGGRCRDCAIRIPLRYPAVELTTGVLVAACVVAFGLTPEALVAAGFCAVLVAVSATDLEHRIVPNRIVLPAALVLLAARTALDPGLEWILGALGAALFLLVAALAYPGGMGMGDVKLALVLGAALGTAVAAALMLALLTALVPSLILLARHGSAARKLAIPFAPFLALGGVIALFAGDRLIDVYLRLFPA